MASLRTALPGTHHRRHATRPLTYRGTHRRRRRAASFVAVAVCAGLPASVLVGTAGGTEAADRRAGVAAQAPSRPSPTLPAARPQPARRTVVAVPAVAPAAPRRRLVGFRTSTQEVEGRSFTGRATWYGPGFHGRRTANGERFDQMAMTAAHRTLAFGTRLRVCTRRSCVHVRVNDRGPFGRGNVLDLSKGAARALGTEYSGVARVTATVIRTRTLRLPVYAAPPAPRPGAAMRAERLSRPDPGPRRSTDAPLPVAAPDIELVAGEQHWSLLASIGAGLGGLLLLAVMALPALRYRRRKGLNFVRGR